MCKTLIILAGPSCSGKSYTIDQILKGEGELSDKLRPHEPANCALLTAQAIIDGARCPSGSGLLHLDLTFNRSESFFTLLKELCEEVDDLIFVTLVVSRQELLERNYKRLISLLRTAIKGKDIYNRAHWFRLRAIAKLFYACLRRRRLASIYEDWKTFQQGFPNALKINHHSSS